MDSKKYRVLLTVIDTGSFTKAADKLGYTPSGITHMMNNLEAELGFKILIRTKKGITLSPVGRELLPIVRSMIQLEESYEQTVSSLRGLTTGTLRIGSYSSFSVHVLPQIIKEFAAAYPNIRIQIIEGINQEIVELLDRRQIDLGVTSSQNVRGYQWSRLLTDPMVAVLPKNHPAAKQNFYDLKQIEEEAFIMPASGKDLDVWHFFEKMNYQPKIAYETFENYSAIALIEQGLGMSIMNQLIIKGQSQNVIVKPLQPKFAIELGFLVPKDILSPAAKKFIEYAKAVVEKLVIE